MPTRDKRELSLIEAHNKLPLDILRKEFFYPAASTTSGESLLSFRLPAKAGEDGGHGKELQCNVTLETNATISREDFKTCYELVKGVQDMYKRSSIGWSATQKKREMKHPAMRFLLVKEHSIGGPSDSSTDNSEEKSSEDEWGDDDSAIGKDDGGILVGFLSFMVTEEEGQDVIYCYEVHVAENHRGNGIGKRLISIMENFARRVGLSKAMLTVFTENQNAMKLYNKIGYTMDEISPKPKRLRTGVVKTDYQIMSKMLEN